MIPCRARLGIGLAVQLTETLCRLLRSWRAAGRDPGSLSCCLVAGRANRGFHCSLGKLWERRRSLSRPRAVLQPKEGGTGQVDEGPIRCLLKRKGFTFSAEKMRGAGPVERLPSRRAALTGVGQGASSDEHCCSSFSSVGGSCLLSSKEMPAIGRAGEARCPLFLSPHLISARRALDDAAGRAIQGERSWRGIAAVPASQEAW